MCFKIFKSLKISNYKKKNGWSFLKMPKNKELARFFLPLQPTARVPAPLWWKIQTFRASHDRTDRPMPHLPCSALTIVA